jgi:hypothetical protein
MSRISCLLRELAQLPLILPPVAACLAVGGFALLATQLSAQVTADLSEGASFRFKIAPDLPEFTFKVIPEVRQPDGDNPQSTVRDIEVYRGYSKQPLQHLTGCNWSDMEPLFHGSDWFRTEDVNFDGYNDVYVMTWWGATGNEGGCMWLFNPATGRFDYGKEFSELGSHGLDPATKTILTYSNGGMVGLVFNASKYKVKNNKPMLLMHEIQDWSFEKKQFHCVVEERKGTAMTVTRDEWSKPGDDSTRLVAPCDPGKLFEGFRH